MKTVCNLTLGPDEWEQYADIKGFAKLRKGKLFFVEEFELNDIDKESVLDTIPTRDLVRYLYDERGREIYDDVSTEQQMYILCAIAAEETSPNNIYNAETLKQALCEFIDKNANKIRFY